MASAPIEQPINLPTDSSSVQAAAAVVQGLQAAMRGLGPAAAAGSSQAQAELRSLGAAAAAAQKDLAAARAVQTVREARANAPPASAEEARARVSAEQAAAAAARRTIDEQTRAVAKYEKDAIRAEENLAKKRAEGRAALAKGFDELIGKVAQAAGAAMLAVSAVAVAIGAKFIGALVSVQAFRESTVNAFAKILGGADAANAEIAKTLALADQIGAGYRESLSSVNALIAQKFSADQARELVAAMADLRTVNPAANLESIVRAIGKIKSTGRLQGDELNMLVEAGLSADLVYTQLAKQMGKTKEQIQAMQRAGKLGADETIKAIVAGIAATTGMPIGKAAEGAASSLQGLLSRVQAIPEALLLSADAGKGMSALKDVLKNIVATFGPGSEGGKALAAALGKLGDAFATVLSGLTGAKGKDAFASFAAGITAAIGAVTRIVERIGLVVGPSIGAFVKGLGAGLQAMGALNKGAGDTATYERLGKALAVVAEKVGLLIGLFVGMEAEGKTASDSTSGGILGAINSLSGAISTIQGYASQVYAAATQIGSNLIAGIIAGINLALPGLLAAVGAVTAATTGTAKTGFGTHSPSVIWRDEIGYMLPAGAAQGVDKGAPLLTRAALRTATTANDTAAGAIGGRAAAPAQGAPVVVNIAIDGRGANDAALADMIEARLRRFFGEASNA